MKRLSNRWMGRVGFSFNNAREHFDTPPASTTPTATRRRRSPSRSVDGGQFAPQSGGSGSGSVYINAKWQFNANAMYQAPYGIEVSGNVFGRQGYPYPLFRQGTTAALGGDSALSVLVTPQIDTFRYDEPVEHRPARGADVQAAARSTSAAIVDVFNVFNANTVLVRNNNVLSTTFNTIAQNLSPRIFRVGVVVGF